MYLFYSFDVILIIVSYGFQCNNKRLYSYIFAGDHSSCRQRDIAYV